jgi:hypothetical protein
MIQFDIYRDSSKIIYADDIPIFPASKKWGNLSNKVDFIFKRLDYLNDTLVSIYDKVEIYNINFRKRNGLTNSKFKISPYIEIIHLIGDLRMIVDELIALLYILEQRKILGDYPQLIEIDSIGVLLKKWETEKNNNLTFFVDYKDFLKILSEINNTYKHSFINDHIMFYRQLEKPTVYALKNANIKFRNNFDIDKNKLIVVPLDEIVNNFNIMFKKYMSLIKLLSI